MSHILRKSIVSSLTHLGVLHISLVYNMNYYMHQICIMISQPNWAEEIIPWFPTSVHCHVRISSCAGMLRNDNYTTTPSPSQAKMTTRDRSRNHGERARAKYFFSSSYSYVTVIIYRLITSDHHTVPSDLGMFF